MPADRPLQVGDRRCGCGGLCDSGHPCPMADNVRARVDDEAPAPRCVWEEDDEGIWQTGCCNAFVCYEGTPSENGARFCQYCGKALEEKRYEPEPIEEDDDVR